MEGKEFLEIVGKRFLEEANRRKLNISENRLKSVRLHLEYPRDEETNQEILEFLRGRVNFWS